MTDQLRPCAKCGIADRNKYSQCKPCKKARDAAYRAANPEKVKAVMEIWRAANSDKLKAWRAARYAENTDSAKAASAVYRAANPGKWKASQVAWRAANPDKVKAARAASYAKHFVRVNAKNVANYAANPDKVKATSAAFRAANPEKVKAYNAAWQAANPDACRINHQNRRAREKEAGGKLSRGLATKLFKLQKGKCPCCALPLGDDFHLDHKMPLALGGANEDGNMQLLRSTCNQQKHARHPVEFMQSRGFLL